jgi:hypothetical protein
MRFYEMQLLRQIFTGEEKETYPFACSNLASEGMSLTIFGGLSSAQRGTAGSTMELEISCICPTNSADFCAGRLACLQDAMFTN